MEKHKALTLCPRRDPTLRRADVSVVYVIVLSESAPTIRRGEHSVPNRYALLESVEDGLGADTADPCPFRYRLGFAVDGQMAVAAPVVGLLLCSSPPAVVGAVALAVVDTVDGCAVERGEAHVSNEAFKAGHAAFTEAPAVADCHALRPVPSEVFL